MKLDDELFHTTPVYEPDSKPYHLTEITFDDACLKKGVVTLNELFGRKSVDNETDSLPFELKDGDRLRRTPDLHRYISDINKGDKLVNGNKHSEFYTISSRKTDKLKDTDIYTDKSVTEIELPELIVCYKDNFNTDVKDICVDEGFYSTDKILFSHSVAEDTEKIDLSMDVNVGDLVEFKSSEVNASKNEESKNTVLTEETEYNALIVPDELRSSAYNTCGNKEGSDTGELNQNGEMVDGPNDELERNVSKESLMPENVHMDHDSGLENCLCKPTEIEKNEGEQQGFQNNNTVSANPAPESTSVESNYCSIVDELHHNTFHFNPSTSVTNDITEEPQNDVREQPLETVNAFKHEDVPSDHLNAASSQIQHDHEESTFIPFSGSITYSGPMVYSGSVSLRSDSSTTSARSFAFPVLQSEWTSSPVRMAKADRRHFQHQQRGWRQMFLCCRF